MIINFPEVEGLKDFPQDIAESLLKELDRYEGHKQPYWIQVMGIPGSGKTTLVRMLQDKLNKRIPYTLAAFDEHMELIPEYHTETDRAAAFARFEAPARAIGFEIFRELIKRKVNVLFEHSTTFPAVRDLMYFVKQAGYALILVQVGVDIDIAKMRVKDREHLTKRHVPESLIEERAAIAADRWEELSTISDARFSVVNNGLEVAEKAFEETVADVYSFVDTLQ